MSDKNESKNESSTHNPRLGRSKRLLPNGRPALHEGERRCSQESPELDAELLAIGEEALRQEAEERSTERATRRVELEEGPPTVDFTLTGERGVEPENNELMPLEERERLAEMLLGPDPDKKERMLRASRGDHPDGEPEARASRRIVFGKNCVSRRTMIPISASVTCRSSRHTADGQSDGCHRDELVVFARRIARSEVGEVTDNYYGQRARSCALFPYQKIPVAERSREEVGCQVGAWHPPGTLPT